MDEHNVKNRLIRAVEHTAPDDVQDVLSRCDTRKGTVRPMMTTMKRSVSGLIAACAALAIVAGGGAAYGQNRAVASVVSLDVNPSIELQVSKREKVLSCTGLNEEGALVLADMAGGDDLKGAKLNVAVNALVGALVSQGYLEDLSSAVLISVEDKDDQRAARLRMELTQWTDQALQQEASQAAVLSQTVTYSAQLEQQAKDNHISTGKAALVERVRSLNGSLTFEALSALSVEELKDLLDLGAPGMPIGKEKAAEIALLSSKLGMYSSTYWEVDAELDEDIPHYEVELISGGGQEEVKIHAFTGAVLTSESEGQPIPGVTPGTIVTPDIPVIPTQPEPPAAGEIGGDKALAAALSHAGVSQSAATHVEVALDRDDGRLEYEIEFKSGGMEYEYTIDAFTGAVLEHEKEWDD